MQLTPPEMPHGFRGLPMALAVALIILALIRYGTSNAGKEREIKMPRRSSRTKHRQSDGIDEFSTSMMLELLQTEKDGFWISTRDHSIGTLLQYQYWADRQRFQETIGVTSPERQFIYTGSEPTNIKVRIVNSEAPSDGLNRSFSEKSRSPETELSPLHADPRTYVLFDL